MSSRLRRRGGVGVKAVSASALEPRGKVDAVTFVESNESLLEGGALADLAAEALRLALVAQRVDGLHLHLEDLLHCRLDLRLAGIQRHHEGDLVVLGAERRLLGHHRSADHLVHALGRYLGRLAVPCACPAHFSRASNASTAPLVNTRVSRRRMSYTLAPCCGSTSTSGRLRAALAKPSSTCAP